MYHNDLDTQLSTINISTTDLVIMRTYSNFMYAIDV